MKQFLPGWWKWLLAGLLSLVLAAVVIWRGAERDQDVIIGEQETPRPSSSITPEKNTKSSVAQTDAETPEKLSSELSALSIEERRQKLTERREFAQKLRKKDAGELLSRLETLWSVRVEPSILEEKALVIDALTEALQTGDENATSAVYLKFSALLRDESLSMVRKSDIASMLGSVQSPQSVQLLLVEYQRTIDDKLRRILGDEIGRSGDARLAGQFRENLSPYLEAAWPLAKNDPNLAQALAKGLAKVGTAAGVQLLVKEVLRSAQTIEGLSDLKDLQGQAAFLALEEVRNPNAIDVLASGLLNADSSELQRYVSAMTLAAMGKVGATRILLQWAISASDREAVWAEQWFGKLRDTASFDLVAATLSQANGITFASAKVRNAVIHGQSNRKQ